MNIKEIDVWSLVDMYGVLEDCYPNMPHTQRCSIIKDLLDNVNGLKCVFVADSVLTELMSYSKVKYPEIYSYVYEKATCACKKLLIDLDEEYITQTLEGYKKALNNIILEE